MPIGKNALKRVSNNGYSNVKTAAPDMENSEVEIPKKAEDKKVAKKAEGKKPTAKKTEKKAPTKVPAEKKKSEEKKPATKKIEEIATETKNTHPDGFVLVALGDDMPVHLL